MGLETLALAAGIGGGLFGARGNVILSRCREFAAYLSRPVRRQP
jgi:hypothetical protein